MKTVWIDLFCFESALKLLLMKNKEEIGCVYYLNINVYAKPFVVLFGKLCNVEIQQLLDVVEGGEHIDGVSLYEVAQEKMIKSLKNWVETDEVNEKVREFCSKYQFDTVKFKTHLKERAYPHVFKIFEMATIAQRISGEKNSLFLIRQSPFVKLFRCVLEKQLYLYSSVLAHLMTIDEREDYCYDTRLNKKYFGSRLGSLWKYFQSWFAIIVLNGVNIFRKSNNPSNDHIKIGVELLQGKFKTDIVNDLYWLKESGINPENVCSFEVPTYDQESSDALSRTGIIRCNVINNPFKLLAHLLRGGKNDRHVIVPSIRTSLKTWLHMLRLSVLIMNWNEKNWLKYQESVYVFGVCYWESIFKKMNVRLLWSMYDIDPQKLAKAQALENINGLFMGSHWSNNPSYELNNQKCYDVLFTWGEHFVKNHFRHYPYLGVFLTGYPCDHYFEGLKLSADEIRAQFPSKFILSYHDNMMAHDLALSMNMQVDIHNMFIALLKVHPDLVLLLKPKREFIFENIKKRVPELNEYLEQGRIKIFLGKLSRGKEIPALIGMASDLVLGIGVSTAATECYFSGTISFHADFTPFLSNAFAQQGLNKVVFTNVSSLNQAIEERILKKNLLLHIDYRECYESLDPFQDGKAYMRTGFVIKILHQALSNGTSRIDAINQAQEKYNDHINQGICVT